MLTKDLDDSDEEEKYGELTIENIKESTPERTVRFVSPEKSNSEVGYIATGTNVTEHTLVLISPEN